MQEKFDTLVELVSQFEGVQIINATLLPDTWINFHCASSDSLSLISTQVAEAHEISGCAFRIVPQESGITYQITLSGSDELKYKTIMILLKMMKNALTSGDLRKAIHNELGLPDLTTTTIRQMAQELKTRDNLCFALVWIENSERDNIAIEGSGNPTQLVGVLARGLNMAIQWADKNIKFHKPKED